VVQDQKGKYQVYQPGYLHNFEKEANGRSIHQLLRGIQCFEFNFTELA
jgi:hypothetical protein